MLLEVLLLISIQMTFLMMIARKIYLSSLMSLLSLRSVKMRERITKAIFRLVQASQSQLMQIKKGIVPQMQQRKEEEIS